MQWYLVCLLILIHLSSPLPIHDYGKATKFDASMSAISTDVDDEDDDEEEENEASFTTSTDGGIGVMDEVTNNGETGTGGVVQTEKQTTQEEVQAIDNVATSKSMAEDRFTKPASNQAAEVEEVKNQITEDHTTADVSEVETMTTVAEEGEYTAEKHSVEKKTVGDVVEGNAETTSDTRFDTGAVEGEEGGTTDGLTTSPMKTVAAEEGYTAGKYPVEEELTEDVVGHTTEAPVLTDMELTGATMTTAAEEEPFATDEYPMEAITTEEKAEGETETSTGAGVEISDVLGMEGSATDYGVGATDAVGDEVIATTDNISDALVRKDDMTTMGTEEDYTSDTYPAEAETIKEVVEVTTKFPVLTDEDLADAAITTAANTDAEPTDAINMGNFATIYGVSATDAVRDEVTAVADQLSDMLVKKDNMTTMGAEEGSTTDTYPLEERSAEKGVEDTTEAPVATDTELMDATTTEIGMTDATGEGVWATTDNEKEKTTEVESTVEGGLYSEGVNPMTTMVSEEDHTTEGYPVEVGTTKEVVKGTTEFPVLTDSELTDATMTTAAEEESYTTEKGMETSTDMDAELNDAVNMGSSATNYGVSTTDAVGDEVTAVTDDLSDALVKKDAMTTMGAEGGYATEAYPLGEVTTEGVFESTTKAPVATVIELMDATTTKSEITDAIGEEVRTTTYDEEEETTKAEISVEGGLYTEGVDPMTTMAVEEDYTTAANPLEEETTKKVVEVTTEAPVLTDTELTDATMTMAAGAEPYTTEKGTETSDDTDAKLTDALIVESFATDYGVSTTDAVADDVTATTDQLSDVLVKKDDMTTMGAEEGSTTYAYPLEGEITEEGVEDTTEAPVATGIELMDATTTKIGMTDAIEEEVWATTDGEKEETTEAESTVEGGLNSEGVDPMATIVAEGDHTAEGHPLEEESTEEIVEITTEAPAPTNMEFTEDTMTTAAEEEPYATEEGTRTSADTDAKLTDALIVESLATDYGVSTTDAVGDEMTADTDDLSDELVKKDAITTMGAGGDYATETYPSVEKTTAKGVVGTTEAPVATDIEFTDATMTMAADEERSTTDEYLMEAITTEEKAEGETETSTGAGVELTDALIIESSATDYGVSTTDAVADDVTATTDQLSDVLVKKDDMTTMVAEEGSTTYAYPLEGETTEEGVADTTEAPVVTGIELMDATTTKIGMTDAIEEEVWATTDGEKEETTEAESTVEGGLNSEGVDPMATIVAEGDHTAEGYPLEEKSTEEVVEITTEAPVPMNMESTNAVDMEGLTSGAIEGELGITTAGLTVAGTAKANVNERTTENMDLQDGGSHSENVDSMTTVAEEEIYTMKAYPLEAFTTMEGVEETTTTPASTAVGLTDNAVQDNSTTSFVVDTTDAVSEVAGGTDDIAESLVKKDVDVDNVEVENQPTETTSPSEYDTSPARLDAITTMNKEEEIAPSTETTAKKAVEWTTETTSPTNKLLDHHVFTGLWHLDDRTEKSDGTEAFTTIDTGKFSGPDVRTSQVTEAVIKANGTETTTVAEGLTPTEAQLPPTTQETSLNSVHQEPSGPITSTVAGKEDVANIGGDPKGLTTRPNDNEQGQASEFVTARTAAGPDYDSSKKPSRDVVVAAASVEVTTSGASSIRSVLSFALILLFSHLLLSV